MVDNFNDEFEFDEEFEEFEDELGNNQCYYDDDDYSFNDDEYEDKA